MAQETSKTARRIIDAAIGLFRDKGYENVSVSEICKAAEIYRSSFYNLFANKDEIILYAYSSVERNADALIAEFIEAKNDFERMWILCDRHLSTVMESGPEVSGALFTVELNRNVGIFDAVYAVDRWYIKLYKNCQAQGIATAPAVAEDIVPLANKLLCHIAYDWCRCKGAFPLKETARKAVEDIYGIAPEYRWNIARKTF